MFKKIGKKSSLFVVSGLALLVMSISSKVNADWSLELNGPCLVNEAQNGRSSGFIYSTRGECVEEGARMSGRSHHGSSQEFEDETRVCEGKSLFSKREFRATNYKCTEVE